VVLEGGFGDVAIHTGVLYNINFGKPDQTPPPPRVVLRVVLVMWQSTLAGLEDVASRPTC